MRLLSVLLASITLALVAGAQARGDYNQGFSGFNDPFSGWGSSRFGGGGGNAPLIYSLDLDPQNIVDSAFRIAAREGRLKDLQELLLRGAQLNSASDEGLTALMYASRNCYDLVVAFLLRSHADPNRRDRYGRTALMHASTGACVPVVRLLKRNPAIDLTVRDRFGGTVFDYAQDSVEVLEVLNEPDRRRPNRGTREPKDVAGRRNSQRALR